MISSPDTAFALSARSAEPVPEVAELSPAIDRATIDARVIALFEDATLREQVRRLDRLELSAVRRLTLDALARLQVTGAPPLNPMEVHRRVVAGVAGEALLLSSALFLGNLAEAERFFGLSFKTLKARLGGTLDRAEGELALRAARTALTAAAVFGSEDAARDYMHTLNFALGGATPAELIRTATGERMVLNELQTQAEGGPL